MDASARPPLARLHPVRSAIRLTLLAILGGVASPCELAAQEPPRSLHPAPIAWERRVLTTRYLADGITAGDLNRDGHPDVVSGPFWYQGPSFEVAREFYPARDWDRAASPTDSLFSHVHDFNRDGWPDILVLGRVHLHQAFWYENPQGRSGPWPKHFAFHRVQGENPPFGDVDGDGRPELVAHWQDRWGLIQPQESAPREPWVFRPISAPGTWHHFYHGEGLGDMNGDGRLDVLLNEGWYEQPHLPAATWTRHDVRFAEKGGAQMFADDVDGDGDADVLTALDAHGWGLAWFESTHPGTFQRHLVMGDRSEESRYGVAFSQPHALAHADLDGDGLRDLVVGKRRWAHGPTGDVEPDGEPVLYWFRLTRTAAGAQFQPHRIDGASGVGLQVTVADLDGDQRPEVLTASKLGAFIFWNRPIPR